MGSQSDWKILSSTEKILKDFDIPHEKKIVSAHRTPDRLYDFAKKLKKKSGGCYCRSRWCSAFTRNDFSFDLIPL